MVNGPYIDAISIPNLDLRFSGPIMMMLKVWSNNSITMIVHFHLF
jgi:hypothetical protein